jgi:hypothetical protein
VHERAPHAQPAHGRQRAREHVRAVHLRAVVRARPRLRGRRTRTRRRIRGRRAAVITVYDKNLA